MKCLDEVRFTIDSFLKFSCQQISSTHHRLPWAEDEGTVWAYYWTAEKLLSYHMLEITGAEVLYAVNAERCFQLISVLQSGRFPATRCRTPVLLLTASRPVTSQSHFLLPFYSISIIKLTIIIGLLRPVLMVPKETCGMDKDITFWLCHSGV